jgi:hypothetical protein
VGEVDGRGAGSRPGWGGWGGAAHSHQLTLLQSTPTCPLACQRLLLLIGAQGLLLLTGAQYKRLLQGTPTV